PYRFFFQDDLELRVPDTSVVGSLLCIRERIKNIFLSSEGHGLMYFKGGFHPVIMEMEAGFCSR
ncbi:hypothetical protein ACVGX5_19065, partial [Enterobacter intestinihominis]